MSIVGEQRHHLPRTFRPTEPISPAHSRLDLSGFCSAAQLDLSAPPRLNNMEDSVATVKHDDVEVGWTTEP